MDIREGQSYKWHHQMRNTFLITHSWTDDEGIDRITWLVTEGNEEELNEVIPGYQLYYLIDSLRDGNCFLVQGPMEPRKKINKISFI